MNFKLALAAVAALGFAGTAQAADLAKKAPAAANYVKVCDAYGAGFFYIPGSDTCLKIGGFVSATYNMYWHSKDAASINGLYGWHRGLNGISTLARADVQLDARTNTELGLLRSFIELEINNASYGTVAATGPATNVRLNKAFIQFGGLTAGRATSFFDFFNGDYTQNVVFEASHADSNVNLLAYTFSFGNGVTATLSIEDPSTDNNALRRATLGAPYGGVHSPDLVANVNVTQAWGSAQAMAVLHMDDAANGTVQQNKAGYALGAGVKVNLPMLGAADQIALQATYAKGAIGYVSTGFGSAAAVDFDTNGGTINQSTVWAIAAGMTHGFTKTITGNLETSYAKYTTSRAAAAVGDFAQWDVIGNLTWQPVKNLSIIGELEYRYMDYAAATGTLDSSALVGVIRVKREF